MVGAHVHSTGFTLIRVASLEFTWIPLGSHLILGSLGITSESHNKAFWTWTRQISEARREIVQWLESGITYSIPVLLY